MIASKQIAFGRGAGKRKPYDAEIEYLESTGTQWILTDFMFDSFDYRVEWGGKRCTWGWIHNNVVEGTWLCGQWDDNIAYVFYGDFDKRGQYHVWANFHDSSFDMKNGVISIDEKNFYSIETSLGLDVIKTPLPLFCNYDFYTNNVAFKATSSTPTLFSYFKIHKDDITVLDLIPVRKGNIGYMYDRVSGQLFGNQGTGEFVLGPDIIDYTAKDYVQDGLVAMWDGIENGGFGVHNEGVGLDWVSCVGGLTIAGSSAMSFYDDGVGSLNRWEFPKIPLPDSVASLTEWTIEILIDFGGIEDTGSFFRGTGYNVNYPNIGRYLTNDRIIAGSHSYALTVPNSDNLASYVAFRMGVNHDVGYAVGAGEMGFFNGAPSWGALAMSEFQFADYSSDWLSRIKSTRCYSRPMTDEELEYNRKIDKARFGL